jgi:uroporphyrinogen-III decarboxylase
MLTARENYLIAARGGKPRRLPIFPDDVNFFAPNIWDADPETGRDWMGVLWIDEPSGKMPDVIHPALTSITKWREYLHFPDLSKVDWDSQLAVFREQYDSEKATIALLHTCGPFLLPINMLGWEEGLAAIYEEPEETEMLITALTDFIIELLGYVYRLVQPDIIFSGDDLSAANGPFVSKTVWESVYKPQFGRIVKAIHGLGALVEFHNCGNNGYLIEEFLDLGVDICQLPMPNDELLADKKHFGSRLVITGGWDRFGEGAKVGASEETVRASARKAIDDYGRDGALIFWDGGIIGESDDAVKKKTWLYDEARTYAAALYQQ